MLKHGPKRNLPENACPLCKQACFFKFPTDYPNIKQLNARYAHAVLKASFGNKAFASRVLGVAYRTLMNRLDMPMADLDVKPTTAGERDRTLEAIENSHPLIPISNQGACRGVYSLLAKNKRAAVYEIRFNDAVKAMSDREEMVKGEKPKVLFVEADESQRMFEFGDLCKNNSHATAIPIRSGLCMVVVMRRG